ncbi:MAG: DUF4349 domain-containing protein [Lachnospiraceae bacterium]|nr:DUF4349 domain-containing protein [Lachnospiraceae bacterium]
MKTFSNQKRLKNILIAAILWVMPLLLTGCGAKSTQSAATEDTVESNAVYDASGGEASGQTSEVSMEQAETSVNVQENNRKLIKTEYLSVQTKQFDEFLKTITQKVTELGGYVEHSDISGNAINAVSNRYASYTIRIPQDKLDEFVVQVEDHATVTSKSENVDDVTLSYVDVQSHITALKTEQESLLSMMEKAETIDDIIAIQSRLTDVRYQLESYESQLRTYDNQIDYSTVNLDVTEVERISQADDTSFGARLKERFLNSIYSIRDGAVNFTVWFLGSLPVLLLLAAFAALIIWLVRVILRKRKVKKDRKPVNKRTDKKQMKEEDSTENRQE